MKKVIVLFFLYISINLNAQTPEMGKPEVIMFPETLYKYLPDSIAKQFPQIIEKAIREKLPNAYLYSFLPDSIAKQLPDSILKFSPKYETDMSNRRLMTAEDLMTLQRISDPKISPDGQWILYTLTTPTIQGNKLYKDIYAVNFDGTRSYQVTSHGANDYNGRWSPDSKKVAFISTRSLTPQIFVMDFPDGEPKQISNIENGVSNLEWSPDSKYFSFTSDVKIDKNLKDKYTNYLSAKLRIYTKLPIRHWDEWTDESYSHLFIMPSEGGEPVDLMKDEPYDTPLKPFGGNEEICWSPDGKEIAYTCKKLKNFVTSTNSDIYVKNILTGETKNITQGMSGYDLAPLYSPDGKWIAFNSMEHDGFESDRHRLMLYNRKSGEITELSKGFDNWVAETIWHPDSKSLFFVAGDKGTEKIFRIAVEDIKAGDKSLQKGEWMVVADGWYNYGGGLGITSKGYQLVFGRQSMIQPLELYTMPTTGGEQKKLTFYSDNIMNSVKPPKVEEKWITAVDGASIHCWVVYPPDFDSTKKYPLITYCQGGPQSLIDQRFHYRWNYFLMASHGYVMILPNRRGVPGFGQKWNDAISKDWAGKPMQDIMSATDIMLKKPYIDKKGSAAIGASAGGYAAFWLAGNHNGRYNALMSHCGVFNLESMYGSTEELWFPDWEYGGPYWVGNNKEFYDKNSPHRFVQNWNTPIMISTGENDFRVPYTQSLEAFTAAQVKGIDSKLIVFPEETHFIAHPQEFIIWDSEVFEFLDKYCKH